MLQEPLHDLWVFLHVEEFTGGEEGPAVGSAPEEGGVVGAGCPAVAVEVALRYPHFVVEEAELAKGFGHVAMKGEGGDAHEHVVEPYGVGYGAHTGELSVAVAVLTVGYVVVVGFDLVAQFGLAALYHGAADGSGIVEGGGGYDLAHEWVYFLSFFKTGAEFGCLAGKEGHAAVGVVGVAFVACKLSGTEHGGVGDSPFVAGEAEVASTQLASVGVELCVGAVDDVVFDAVDGGFDVGWADESVVVTVVGTHEVEWGGGVVLYGLCREGRCGEDEGKCRGEDVFHNDVWLFCAKIADKGLRFEV